MITPVEWASSGHITNNIYYLSAMQSVANNEKTTKQKTEIPGQWTDEPATRLKWFTCQWLQHSQPRAEARLTWPRSVTKSRRLAWSTSRRLSWPEVRLQRAGGSRDPRAEGFRDRENSERGTKCRTIKNTRKLITKTETSLEVILTIHADLHTIKRSLLWKFILTSRNEVRKDPGRWNLNNEVYLLTKFIKMQNNITKWGPKEPRSVELS